MLGMSPVKQIIFFLSLIISGLLFAGTSIANPDDVTGASQKWAVVNGFRSAHFGMTEFNVTVITNNEFNQYL